MIIRSSKYNIKSFPNKHFKEITRHQRKLANTSVDMGTTILSTPSPGKGMDSTTAPRRAHTASLRFKRDCQLNQAALFTRTELDAAKYLINRNPMAHPPNQHVALPARLFSLFHGSLAEATLEPTSSASPSPPHRVETAITPAGCCHAITAIIECITP